jgi:hypothetical protein
LQLDRGFDHSLGADAQLEGRSMIARLAVYLWLLLNVWQQPMGYGGQGAAGYTGPLISNVKNLFCGGSTACTVANFSPNPATNNVIFVATVNFSAVACNSSPPTDTLGNTYSFINTTSDVVSTGVCAHYAISSSGGTDAVTCHAPSSSSIDCWAALVTGNNASVPLDTNCIDTAGTATSGTGTNNMPCSTSITPASNDELYIGYATASSGTPSNGSLLTFYNLAVDDGIFYQQHTAATITPAVTLNTSGVKYVIVVAVFKK